MQRSRRAVLGVSAHFHDASAALVVDGEIVAAAAEERFTRLKHDSNFPRLAIEFCLQQGGLAARQLDAVVFYEDPSLKFTRVVASTLAGFPRSRSPFVSAMKDWLTSKLWLRDQISRELDIHPRKIRFVRHHDSHMAQAFLASPFDEAAILTMDAVGEWTSTAIGHGDRRAPDPVRALDQVDYPHSLGLAYAAFTAFLGFRPNDAEASTMALAAFGRPRYAAELRRIIRAAGDGLYQVDSRFFSFLSSDFRLFTPEFVRIFGPPRDFRSELPFDCLEDAPEPLPAGVPAQRFADLAASVQLVLEEVALALAERAWRRTGSSRLCIAGGVALNAVANSKVIERSPFQEVFIPPDPGDGGAALGAALLEYSRRWGDLRPLAVTPRLGKSFHEDSPAPLLREIDPADWAPFVAQGCALCHQEDLETVAFDSSDELIDVVTGELLAGSIVGWVQGRFELGPRALGNRSIFVDPRNIPAVKRLSSRVKQRARFRPYALSIREEDVPLCFDFSGGIPHCARWMQMVKRVRTEAAPLVRGAMHCDGTTRLQVCAAQDNPRFHHLLSAFGERRGLGALLNTSFNEAGYPMVASPAEALLMFARTEMDVLVVDNFMVTRHAHENTRIRRPAGGQLAVGALGCGGVNP